MPLLDLVLELMNFAEEFINLRGVSWKRAQVEFF